MPKLRMDGPPCGPNLHYEIVLGIPRNSCTILPTNCGMSLMLYTTGAPCSFDHLALSPAVLSQVLLLYLKL